MEKQQYFVQANGQCLYLSVILSSLLPVLDRSREFQDRSALFLTLSNIQANQLRLFEGLAARLIAETLLAQELSDVREAHQWLEKATAADRANKLNLGLAHDYADTAEIHRHNADQEQMLQSLIRARDLFEECGARGFTEEMEQCIASAAASIR